MCTQYWSGLLDWVGEQLINEGMIHPEDLDLVEVTDSPEDAVATIVAADRARAEDPAAVDPTEDGLNW